ncbi:MAG: cyclopropane-fatty-acyl-phospholipid synthase family protein [Pirellulaceae bacterium]
MIVNSKPNREPWSTRWCRNRVLARLKGLEHGTLDLSDPWGELSWRGADAKSSAVAGDRDSSAPHARIDVLDGRFYRRIFSGGDIGAAESWMAGEWTSPNVVDVVRFFIQNLSALERLDRGWASLRHWGSRWLHWRRGNSLRGSRRNISAHYDLGNTFYQTFLDPTMAYSAGLFRDSATSMEQASRAKFDRICRKLDLQDDDHLLEIGTGWGGFAIHAAQHYGCQVTTTTISREQYEFAVDWVRREGLEHRIDVRFQDYRELSGQYDKLVSIEMIEAVGHDHLGQYLATCRDLLRRDGVAVLQAILMVDQRHARHLRSSDFIREYIFPGGDLPSVGSIVDHATRFTDLRLMHYEEISEHYAETLRRWRRAFEARTEQLESLGFDAAFRRMWVYYLAYCEAAFTERQVNSAQLVLGARNCASRAHERLAPIAADLAPRQSVELSNLATSSLLGAARERVFLGEATS